ncbi:hypothetical protein B0T17DRAFT_457825, partial [Bombardia bombarda]
IPLTYRLILLAIKPLAALQGAYMMLFNPSGYISTMTRSTISYDPSTQQFALTQLAGAWLYFAFVELVVLAQSDDVRLWRLLCGGMLLSDLAYMHSVAQG